MFDQFSPGFIYAVAEVDKSNGFQFDKNLLHKRTLDSVFPLAHLPFGDFFFNFSTIIPAYTSVHYFLVH